jgi:hypothetical protein
MEIWYEPWFRTFCYDADVLQVVYFNGAKWASRTNGRKPTPKYVRYKDASNGGPWIELVSEDGSITWKSN